MLSSKEAHVSTPVDSAHPFLGCHGRLFSLVGQRASSCSIPAEAVARQISIAAQVGLTPSMFQSALVSGACSVLAGNRLAAAPFTAVARMAIREIMYGNKIRLILYVIVYTEFESFFAYRLPTTWRCVSTPDRHAYQMDLWRQTAYE